MLAVGTYIQELDHSRCCFCFWQRSISRTNLLLCYDQLPTRTDEHTYTPRIIAKRIEEAREAGLPEVVTKKRQQLGRHTRAIKQNGSQLGLDVPAFIVTADQIWEERVQESQDGLYNMQVSARAFFFLS